MPLRFELPTDTLEIPTGADGEAPAVGLPRIPRVGVVSNPRSHRNRDAAPQALDAANVTLTAPHSREALGETLAGFARDGVDMLVIDGGDGTVRDVLSHGAEAFGAQWPRLLVVPKGKTNALAWDLGMRRMWSLGDALGAAEGARIETRRPLLIERIDGEGIPAVGFIFGAGVFNTAIEAGQVAHRYGAFQGFAVGVTTGWGILQALFGVGRSPWRRLAPIRLFGERGELPLSEHGTDGRRFGIGMSTLDRFPLGLRPFGKPRQGVKCLVLDAPLRRVMALVPLILMGMHRAFLSRLGVHRSVGEEYVLDLGEGFILDGEVFPAGRYRLRRGPELRFLVP